MVSFLLFLDLGVPVAHAIGLSAVATIVHEGLPTLVIFQRMMSGMNVFSLLAIPFFVFAGELMPHGGIADKIVDFAKALVGRVRGGVGMSTASAVVYAIFITFFAYRTLTWEKFTKASAKAVISVGAVMRAIPPLYGALTAALLAVTCVPQFSPWLPRVAGSMGR